jgi:hypothetical protein
LIPLKAGGNACIVLDAWSYDPGAFERFIDEGSIANKLEAYCDGFNTLIHWNITLKVIRSVLLRQL